MRSIRRAAFLLLASSAAVPTQTLERSPKWSLGYVKAKCCACYTQTWAPGGIMVSSGTFSGSHRQYCYADAHKFVANGFMDKIRSIKRKTESCEETCSRKGKLYSDNEARWHCTARPQP